MIPLGPWLYVGVLEDTMITYRRPQSGDVERIAAMMHPLDILECRVADHTPWQGLHEARVNSIMCWTAEVDGWPEAMFGVVPANLSTGRGYPWLLGTSLARQHAKAFLTHAPVYLETIEHYFPRLEGMVSTKNTAAIRWLHRLKFVVDTDIQVVREEPMRHFHKGF